MLGNQMTADGSSQSVPVRRYRWPWLVLAAVVLAVIVAVLMMSRELERVRRIRDATTPPASTTNSPAVAPR